MVIRDIAIAFGFTVDKAAEAKVNNSIKTLKSTAIKALGAIGIGFTLKGIKDAYEQVAGVNEAIRDATDGMGDQVQHQRDILKASNESRQNYEDMAKSVSKLVQNKDVFSGIKDASDFAALMAKSFAASGKETGEVASLMNQITMAMSRGEVSSRNMLALFNESPKTVNMLAEALGVSKEQFKDMVSKGQVSAKMLRTAFEKSSDRINGSFNQLEFGWGNAMSHIRNTWLEWLGEMGGATLVMDKVSRFVARSFDNIMFYVRRAGEYFIGFSDAVGGIGRMFKWLIGTTAALGIAVKIAFNWAAIKKGVEGFGKALAEVNWQVLALIAVFILIALAIDDFINFMQGNNSIIGKVLGKMGIDADKVRAQIVGAWNQIRTFLISTWNTIKQAATTVWNSLTAFWKKNGNDIKAFLITLWGVISAVWKAYFEVMKALAVVVFGFLQAYWNRWGSTIVRIFTDIWNVISATFQNAINVIMGILKIFTGIFTGDWALVWEGVKQIFGAVWDEVKTIFGAAVDAVIAILSGLFGPTVEKVKGWYDAIVSWFTQAGTFIQGKIAEIVQFFQPFLNIIDKVTGFVGKGLDKAAGAAKNALAQVGENPTLMPGFAGGTGSSPDTFVAGEEGPELIAGAKGRKIFTAAQTGNIFDTLKAIASMEEGQILERLRQLLQTSTT